MTLVIGDDLGEMKEAFYSLRRGNSDSENFCLHGEDEEVIFRKQINRVIIPANKEEREILYRDAGEFRALVERAERVYLVRDGIYLLK